MTLSAFRVRFPEFARADDGLVSALLAEAAKLVEADRYGSDLAEAQGYQAAYLLSLSAFGRGARSTGQTSLYMDHLTRLRLRRTPRGMVTGAQYRREGL
jgi:hypothetical protein